jgi:hypothetical protein
MPDAAAKLAIKEPPTGALFRPQGYTINPFCIDQK